MRSFSYRLLWCMACIGMLVGATMRAATADASAAPLLRWEPAQAEIHLSGTSNLRRWACSGTALDASMEVVLDATRWEMAIESLLAGEAIEALPQPAVSARFEHTSLDCPSPRMKQDLLEAVRAEEHPTVLYRVTGVHRAQRDTDTDAGVTVYDAEVEGVLTLAGVQRPTVHAARVRIHDAHTFEIEGRINLNMHDFDVEPPVALLGLLRVHPDFTVSYRIRTRRVENEADGVARAAGRDTVL